MPTESRARSLAGAALALALPIVTWAVLRAPAARTERLEIGAVHAAFLRGPWSRPERADVPPAAAPDGRNEFLYRRLEGPGGFLLPVAAKGDPIRLTLRCSAPVRSGVGVFVAGERVGELLVQAGVWDRYPIDVPRRLARGTGLEVSLAARPMALVRGAHTERGTLLVDSVEAESALGVRLSDRSALLVASIPVGLLLLFLASCASLRLSLAVSLAGAALAVLTARTHAAVPFLISIPRLVWPALLAGLVVAVILRRAQGVTPGDRVGLAALVTLGILFHGALVFLPRFNPNDLEIQVHRTLDAAVPADYASWLRYGSHLPTPTQPYGGADFALGKRVLVPYTPLPYLVFYALHLLGLDIYWAMPAFTVVLALLVAPWLWLAARRLWDRGAAWVAVLLYTLDLAVWHHVARCRTPAAFGGAIGTAVLLFLALRAPEMGSRRVVLRAGLLVALALLAYSSLPVLLGLFAAVLFVLLGADARALAPPARRGLAAALIGGGLLAGVLYYFHYVPALVRGAGGIEAAPDPVRVYTFFIFHNEGRPSLRLWYEGYWIGLLAGLLAAPAALRRAVPTARPVLVSWLLAWGLVMLLKEPFFLPKLLRWAKEDQFLSPLLCLMIGAGVTALPRPWMRWCAGALALAGAATIQGRDFWLHATNRLIL